MNCTKVCTPKKDPATISLDPARWPHLTVERVRKLEALAREFGALDDSAVKVLIAGLDELEGDEAEIERVGGYPACPSWCVAGAGHEFDGVTPDGEFLRWHRAFLDDEELVAQVLAGERFKNGKVIVAEPHIEIHAVDGECDAVRARAAALSISQAAIRLDEILADLVGGGL